MTRLIIPGTFPNLNEIIEVSKKHHMQYSNMKRQYTQIVYLYAKAQKIPKYEKVDIEFVWYCKNKRMDKDNIMVGQKFVLDGLVKAGVLENDGWNQIGDISHTFAVDKKNPRVEVNLKELVVG